MSGESLGRRLLQLDAVYCAGAGLVAVVLFAPLARLLETPRLVPIVVGAAAVGWAVVLVLFVRRAEWRRPVAAVAAANFLAAASIAVLAVAAAATVAQVLLAAVAMEVAAFGAGQAAALRG